LSANAVAGILSATVVSLFENSIAQVTALAVLMPIVANIGGMGGVQTATIMVRAISLGHTELETTGRIIMRQSLIGLLVGLVFCLAGGLIATALLGKPYLGLVFGASLAAVLFFSGALGSLIPIGLKRVGIDPALVSGSLLTTITDSLAFLVFLGLGTIVLL
ncbi:MAG: magnesium transporter, partial [Thiohalorhabdaceae bacterium]